MNGCARVREKKALPFFVDAHQPPWDQYRLFRGREMSSGGAAENTRKMWVVITDAITYLLIVLIIFQEV